MFHILRKIRKSLIESGSARKYLLYTLGEIVLVVIGILIALQINNWNEDRKNIQKEKFYLQSLLSELEKNKAITDNQLKYQHFQEKNGRIVLDAYMSETYPIDSRDLIVAIEHTAWLYPTNYVKDGWDELNSTGNIALIRNDSLRRELRALYASFDYVVNLRKEFNHFLYGYREAVTSVVDPYVRQELNEKLHPTGLTEEITSQIDMDLTIRRLKNVEKLDGHISNVLMKNRPLILIFEETINSIDNVLSLVKQELQ